VAVDSLLPVNSEEGSTMRRMRETGAAVAVVAVGMLAGAGGAGADNSRFVGCAAESGGCSHSFTGDDVLTLRFTDREDELTKYRVCVTDILGRDCFKGKTPLQEGRPDKLHFQPRASGKHTVRWKVDGSQVARWDFKVTPKS
jgi:hypothetical protein